MKLGVVLAVVSAILLQPVDAVAAPALEAETAPSPGLSPEEVVRIQVEALRTNDATNAGIALVF